MNSTLGDKSQYFIELAYKGTDYRGWQNQPDQITIQSSVEGTFSKILNQKISCHACGRTDAGVHATQFFTQIDTEKKIQENFSYKLNKMLSKDIKIFRIIPVDRSKNVQHDVISRTYTYFIHRQKSPFLSDLSTMVEGDLDLQAMKTAFSYLKGALNFEQLCRQPDIYKSTFCKIFGSKFSINNDHSMLSFSITADRFLRGMVRLIMGRMIDVGKRIITPKEFLDCFTSKSNFPFINAAFPQGLYLSQVSYPFLEDVKRPFPPLLLAQFEKGLY